MYQLTSSKGKFGPFKEVIEFDTFFRCGTTKVFKTVCGEDAVIQPYDGFIHPEDPAPLVAEAAKAVANAVNTVRNEKEAGGFNYMGKRIDSDSAAVRRITMAGVAALAAKAAAQPFSVEWTCADNSTLVLDADGMIGMVAAATQAGAAVHAVAKAKKEAAKNAVTPADVQNIDVAAGWPE